MANILLVGIYPDSAIEALDMIHELAVSLKSEKGYDSEFELDEKDHLAIGPHGKVGNIKLKIPTRDDPSESLLSASVVDVRGQFLFDGVAIWQDEMFTLEYFQKLANTHGSLDAICLIVTAWPPEGDHRLSRWIEWVSFYDQILAPNIEHKMDLYVLFLYRAPPAHIQIISSIAATCGIRCFIVGELSEYDSKSPRINSQALSRWLMTLMVDVRPPVEAKSSRASTMADEVITPRKEELDPNDPLAGIDLGALGFKMDVEDEEDPREPILGDLDEDDPLAGFDLAGFKVEYEDEDGEESEQNNIKLEGDPLAGVNLEGFKLEYETDSDEADPDTVVEAESKGGFGLSDFSNEFPREKPKHKPMRFGDSHQFLKSTISDLRANLQEELEGLESASASIQASIHYIGEMLIPLETSLQASQERYDELSVSTKLVSGYVISRSHKLGFLSPSPSFFIFDELVHFPIKDAKTRTISGNPDPKCWGPDPANPRRFIGKVKNDIYRSAKCEFELLGYEKDVLEEGIKDLKSDIENLSERIQSRKDHRTYLRENLEITRSQIAEIDVQVALYDMDLERLQDPASLDWDMQHMRAHLKGHSLYGIAQDYELCSVTDVSLHNLNQQDVENHRFLLKQQIGLTEEFYDGLANLFCTSKHVENQVEEIFQQIESLTAGLNLKSRPNNLVKQIKRDMAQLKEEKRIWRAHMPELDELASEAKKIIRGLGSERATILEQTCAFQKKMQLDIPGAPSKPTLGIHSAMHDTDAELSALNQMDMILRSDTFEIGAYATMKYHKTTKDGLLALQDNIAARIACKGYE
ncbi:hypothetical protein H072_10730 [Dactylellina haptotyla CBS 200.50]|uniref:Uncharacterized protein n=1 Tax=Dactylellina haptotyla (strain CBS 200.50) TaxID=1284197 RepID=S8BKH1_DACHA|nr:hypothetical protein H072_10730 [Dactylellina haptotyla CBS 200.50]